MYHSVEIFSEKPFTVQYLQSTNNKPSICVEKGMITFAQSGKKKVKHVCANAFILFGSFDHCQVYAMSTVFWNMPTAWTKD